MTLFSVIVPTFNSEATIEKTINSILDQDYPNLEILIIDNHSTDKTKEIIDSFEDKRVSFHLINNKGLPANSRNQGIDLAQGEYIAFCDSDDIWQKNKLSEVLRFIKFDVICHNVSIKNSLPKKISKFLFRDLFFKKIPKLNHLIKNGNYIALSSLCIKAEILKKNSFDISDAFRAIEDFELVLRLLKKKYKAIFINKKLGTVLYRELALSYISNQFRCNRALRIKHFRDYKPQWYCYNIGTYLFRENRKNFARKYFQYAIGINSIEITLKSVFYLLRR